MSVNIQGMLKFYGRKSMKGLMKHEDGTPCSNKEVRDHLNHHLSLGHTCIPMCPAKECPDFDYFGKGCPGHGIHYYDNNDNEISKEEYDRQLAALSNAIKEPSDDDILI